LGAVILTAVADFLKVYLARTSHAAHTAATKVPGALKAPRGFLPARLFRRKGRARQKAPYQGYSSPPGGPWRRWSLLVGKSVVAAGISFLLGVGAVTTIEHSAGKSLSCLVWEECPVQSSSADEDDGNSDTSTQPSIFGGGPSAGSGAAANVQPASLQQHSTPASGTPETPLSQTRSKSAGSVGSTSGTGEGWQSTSEQQQDSTYYSEEYEQRSSSSTSAQEAQDGGSAGWEKETTGEYEFPSVPWST
jgi:hypothetical protein